MVTKGTLWSVFFPPSRKDNDGIRAFFLIHVWHEVGPGWGRWWAVGRYRRGVGGDKKYFLTHGFLAAIFY